MADHVEEQILGRFQQQLKDAASVTVAGTSIVRERVDPAKVVPDINIEMGADDIIDGSDENMAYMDGWLNVDVIVTVKNSTGLAAELLDIRKQIHIAIYADVQLALPDIIIDGKYTGAGKPVTSGDAENETAQQILNYQFRYRHTQSDPSV